MGYYCIVCKKFFNTKPAFSQTVIIGSFKTTLRACKECSRCPECKGENGMHKAECSNADLTSQ